IGKDDPSYDNWAKPIRALAARLGASFGGAKPTASDDIHKCSDEKPKVKDIEVKESGGKYQINASISQGTHPLNKVVFKLDGKEVSAQGGGGSRVYSTTISIPGGGHTVSVDVEDKAGYTGSASKGVSGGGNSDLSANSPGGNTSSPVIFSWSGGTGPFTVEWKGSSSGTIGSAGQSAIQPLPSGNYKWKVTDSTGKESSWQNFKVN
ncbi:hypothetical protein KBB17_01455, partial [Candidatus Saccharibacteria bacterium]|nr:hypothetical protein [Candidatus Saccharibacteria bacterium]